MTKVQALNACEQTFKAFGCSPPSQKEYDEIYIQHLEVYAATLKLLSCRQDLESFSRWAIASKLPLSVWTLRFSMLLTGDNGGFAPQRLTHLSGNDSVDQIAKAAWNVAWDIVLLERADEMRGHVVTHDRGLASWFAYATSAPPFAMTLSKVCDVVELVRSLEDSLGVSCNFDAEQLYPEGLWPLRVSGS